MNNEYRKKNDEINLNFENKTFIFHLYLYMKCIELKVNNLKE